MKPTKEQKDIFYHVEHKLCNLFINAYAGTGKSTTISAALKFIPKDKSITFLAFNSHIQKELKEKINIDNKNLRIYTSHGVGLSALKRKYGNKIEFDEFKLDKHINKFSKKWDLTSEFDNNEDYYQYIKNLKKIVDLCRNTLTINKKFIPFLIDKHDIDLNSVEDVKRILKILDSMTQDRKSYDYVDMVYLPAVDNGIWFFPQDYVIVDEAQDLTVAQQRLITKMLKKDRKTKRYKGRLIAIGDRFQSIYGFVGINEKTFDWFKNFDNIKELNLSHSFRCSKNVIKKAQEIVPEIKALDDAPDGEVREGNVLNEANDGDFILCRTTAPLIKLFFEFLAKKKKVIINGSDIGIKLIGLIDGFKDIETLMNYWNKKLNDLKSDLYSEGIINVNEHSGYSSLNDQVTTLEYLSSVSATIDDLKHNIKNIFTDKLNGIVLSTIHKAKGLEAKNVFIIRPDLIPMPSSKKWQYAQEKNLEYVAITRAKLNLIYDYEWTNE